VEVLGITISVETLKAAATLAILAAAVYNFVRERIPPDLTALLALCGLLVTGVLSPVEAFSGFSHPATISVAAVLVLSAGIEHTGLLNMLARRVLAPLGRSEFFFTLVMMILIGALSAFINNTAAVAIFIPVVLEVCRRAGTSPGRVLMPMSHAATIGGMCTLIGTSTNLVAHEFARSQGLSGFTMFELGKVGLPMVVVGYAYMLLLGRRFLPGTSTGDRLLPGQDDKYVTELMVQAHSPLIGKDVSAEGFERTFDLELLGVESRRPPAGSGEPRVRFGSGDVLHVRGALQQVLALSGQHGLEIRRPRAHQPLTRILEGGPSGASESAGVPANAASPAKPLMAEVVVLTPSGLIGETLTTSRFAERHDTVVLALKRRGDHGGNLSTTPLRAGDVLVVEGEMESLRELAEKPGFLVIGTPAPQKRRAGQLAITLVTMIAVIGVVSFGLAPIVTAAVAGSAVLMLTGCLRPREAYQAIDISLVCLLAGSLGLGFALEKTGLTELLAQGLSGLTGLTGPYIIVAGFFIVSVIVSELMSNSGTVALLGPIAISTSMHLGINPMSLLAAVTFGASAAFAMPIGYQTSLMIYGPGGYRFIDFLRMGIVLDLILGILALWLIPIMWPLGLP
jgi:di/tricarboxylate transporter